MKNEIDPLKMLIGYELSSLEFVRDYLQLRFDGPMITAYSLPKIKSEEETYEPGVLGYCDTLCSCISSTVRSASIVEGKEISLEFDSGIKLTISLKSEDYQGAEVAIFRKNSDEWWVW
jgi:hypothetical protein